MILDINSTASTSNGASKPKPETKPANTNKESPKIQDSGNRRQFDTGAVRDIQKGKGRCDLLPLDVIAGCYAHQFGKDDNSAEIFSSIYKFTTTGDTTYLYELLTIDEPFGSYPDMFLEVSKHFEEGAGKYGENNWQKGIPVHCYIDSAVRHYLKYQRGDEDEPHDRAFCWNILCAIWTCKHKPEMNGYLKTAKTATSGYANVGPITEDSYSESYTIHN